MYQVVWMRLLTLIFGSSTYAISTVLGVFMFGLALGSFLIGKYIQKITNAQKIYALIEIGIGIYALLFLPLLSIVQSIHSSFFPYLYDNIFLLNIFRISLAFFIIILPTTLMGATVPLLSQILTRSVNTIGRDVGLLYAINTLGAALGAFISAFLIMPFFGMDWIFYTGSILNIIIGVVILKITPAPIAQKLKETIKKPAGDIIPITARQSLYALIAFALTGFLSMIYENAWSRALVLVFGTSVYAFATMLTTYLFGLGLGSIIVCRFIDKIKRPLSVFTLLTALMGLSIFITTPIIGRLPDYFVGVFADKDVSWHGIASIEFLVCFLIMLGPTLAGGACFPLVSRIFMHRKNFQIGRTVADVYTFNTAGCIVGSIVAGFLLIPLIGVEKSLLLGGASSILIAAGLVYLAGAVSKPGRLLVSGGLAALAVIGLWKLPCWNQKVMNSGVYTYSEFFAQSPQKSIAADMSRFRLLYHRDGPSATVAVLESLNSHEKTRFLRVNGKTDGSDGGDNYTQALLGLLPIMYCQDPKDVLVIGLGTGITLGSVLDFPVLSADCVEISPAVVEASNFFVSGNKKALGSPRANLYVLDGRTWLMAMPRGYDIITSEPSHPWQTGNANLFTVEFFRIASKRLNKGGIFCQWLPYYRMEKEHFKLLMKSFQSVFAHVHVWLANTDVLVIGSHDPLSMDYAELEKRMSLPKVESRFQSIGMDSTGDFLSFFYLDENAVKEFIAGVQDFNSDRHPVLEFQAPKFLSKKAKPDIFFNLLELSYTSRLPLTNCENIRRVHTGRITQRMKYYREWGIPKPVFDNMVYKSLPYPFAD
ncbi:MAG: fused MFS/spermidine synthase [Thermodesulfobacteriota bacterium]|nr:fused MFS/spermidine synthase [Thermodesulfobacteriota bacterium]